MAESTTQRIIAEAALAKRFETQINDKASLSNIPELVSEVERFDPAIDSDSSPTNEIDIAFDTDGTPYLKNGA